MINKHLLKKELKSTSKIWILFLGIITMYSFIIVGMYDPEFSSVLDSVVASAPELLAAFGFTTTPTDLVSFITNYLYGFIVVVIPLIFTIILSYRLVGRYVDNGSMAYLLTTPYSRKKVILTQITSQFLFIVGYVMYIFLIILFATYLFFPNELDIFLFLKMNIGLLGLHLFFASITFLISTIFNDAKKIIGICSALVIVSVLLQMISQVSSDIEFFKYFTPLTLFATHDILAGETLGYILMTILYISAIFFYIIAVTTFCKKDLPL